ncbi:hypothetical protein GN244_ATG19905 [Phytophthora infestans]|uniref:Uncharacterized protein n=1 Tax=Phytophthora infestans TaxID=4787 RepID=A0A833RN65_PHYIN|nr:hypothetical protein GN244_ATG19905 [Phytophthora infestans]
MARAVIGSRAVETFLRNFEGEKSRYQEILEITLCYGVQCLAHTQNPDFYVRNASQPIEKETGTATGGSALYSLPPPFDEIDFHTQLLGKQFVDLAWKLYTGREGAQINTRQELEEKFISVDQRKVPTAIPALALPVTSFAEFLAAYIAECVRRSHRTGHAGDEDKGGSDEALAVNEKESIYGLKASVSEPRRRSVSTPRAAMGNTKSQGPSRMDAERKQRPLHPQPQQRQMPRSLQHVQSKIQPELEARRQKVLRVKKTQSQRMAETLARARLAEYDARRELQDVRERRLGPKKMPISEITKGAAALEIVDDFMKSSLMDKFGRENQPNSILVHISESDQYLAQEDPLKVELYGTAALDSSFLGCKPAPETRRRSESRLKQPRRNYNGWLGDYGPLHTKTVRPEWDETEDDAPDPEPRAKGSKFEWNFEHLPGGRHETVDRPTNNNKTTFESYDGVRRRHDDFDDGLSDGPSANSDPVFRWLKDAV